MIIQSLVQEQTWQLVRSLSCLSVDFNENCTFQPLQLDKVCTISLRGKNEGFVNDTVPGVVSIVQENTSFCNQTEKEVTIYKGACCLEMHVYFCIEMILFTQLSEGVYTCKCSLVMLTLTQVYCNFSLSSLQSQRTAGKQQPQQQFLLE